MVILPSWADPCPLGHNSDVAMPVVFSWSAGKDSAFGLRTLLHDASYEVRALLTTITEGYDRVSMSGVREALLDRQAEALGLPVIKVRIPPVCTNELYEQRMTSTLAAETFDEASDRRHHVVVTSLDLRQLRLRQLCQRCELNLRLARRLAQRTQIQLNQLLDRLTIDLLDLFLGELQPPQIVPLHGYLGMVRA